MHLSNEEKETVIRCSAVDQEWDITTADPRMIRYLRVQGYEDVEDHQLATPIGHFGCPSSALGF
jgi:hypothetical protein